MQEHGTEFHFSATAIHLRRKYSDSERAAALAAVDLNGGNVDRTARDLGIPRKTLDEWVKGRSSNWEMAELRQAQKKDIADKIEDLVHIILDAMPDKVEKAGLSACAVSVGVGIDKMRLMRNQPTGILEVDDKRKQLAEKLNLPIEVINSALPVEDATENVQ